MSNRLPWGRILAEAVAIVASILLAFGIQAWWDGRQDRAEEVRALEALLSETRENLDLIQSSIATHDAYASSAERLLDMSLGLADVPAEADLTNLLADALARYRTTNYVMGTVTALLASGDIGLISNFDIRRRVAELPSAFEEATEDEVLALDVRTEIYLPFMVDKASKMLPGNPNRSQPLPAAMGREREEQIRALLGDDELEALLGNSIAMNVTSRRALERASGVVEELVALLTAEIAAARGDQGSA